MTSAAKPVGPSREEFSERLLKGSVGTSCAPVVDIDWDAPLDPDKFYLPPRTVSLYGTPLWDEIIRAQRIELSPSGTGEHLVGRYLVREHPEPGAVAQAHAHGPHQSGIALRADRTGRRDPAHGDVRQGHRAGRRQTRSPAGYYHRVIINTLPFFFRGSVLWVAALIGEEIFDSLQRQMMDDPELQPIIHGSCEFMSPKRRVTSSSRATGCASGRADAPARAVVHRQRQRPGRLFLPLSVFQPHPLCEGGPRRSSARGPGAPARIATKSRRRALLRWPSSSRR